MDAYILIFVYNRIIILLLFCGNNRIYILLFCEKVYILRINFFRRIDTSLVALFRFVIFFCYGNFKKPSTEEVQTGFERKLWNKTLILEEKIFNTFYYIIIYKFIVFIMCNYYMYAYSFIYMYILHTHIYVCLYA